MKNVIIGQRGTITLPKSLRDALHLKEGSVLHLFTKDGSLILEPTQSGEDQVLLDIQQGIKDLKNGKFIEFSSIKEFDTKVKEYEG